MEGNNDLDSNNDLIMKEFLAKYKSLHDPVNVIKEVEISLKKSKNKEFPSSSLDDYKALSLYEFTNGLLMTDIVEEKYKTLAINMMRELQREYDCTTTAEKSLTELAALSYVRILDLQELIRSAFTREQINSHRHGDCGTLRDFYSASTISTACQRTKFLLKLVSILSKEHDRAYRQYITAIQMLFNLKQPPLQVNIKTQTAVVGNQQIVQSNNHE